MKKRRSKKWQWWTERGTKWYHDPEYQAVIEAAFGKTQGTDYEFTKEDIDKIKAYVDANGIGTTMKRCSVG